MTDPSDGPCLEIEVRVSSWVWFDGHKTTAVWRVLLHNRYSAEWTEVYRCHDEEDARQVADAYEQDLYFGA